MDEKSTGLNRQKEAVYAAYERWSETYDQQVNPTRDLSSAVLKQLVPPLKGLVIVEAGCGTGLNTTWLAQGCQSLLGLDFSDSMLALAREKVDQPHVQLCKHDLREVWPIKSQTADLVVINLVLEHIPNLEQVLSHAATAMKPNAKLIITEYHPDLVAKGLGARIENNGTDIIDILNHWHPVESYVTAGQAVRLTLETISHWCEMLDENGLPIQTNVDPLIMSVVLRKIDDD